MPNQPPRLAQPGRTGLAAETAAATAGETGAPAEAAAPTTETTSETAESAARVRVVVAEDEALIRMDLVEMLAEEGYEVVGQAATGEAAVALVERLRPDVVLLDVRMPVMDGISAAEVITSRHACAIVMLTAFSERELVERAAVAGAAAYLVKPVSAVHLIPAIEVARARQSEAAALSAEVETLELRLAARKVIERAKGILMRDFGLDEAGAFAWLRREAMDRRMSMADVAEVVTRDDNA